MPCLAQPEAGLAGEFGVIFDEEEVHAGVSGGVCMPFYRRHGIPAFITKR